MLCWFIVPAAVGTLAYVTRTGSLNQRLAQARTLVGTERGKLLLESLAEAHPDNAEIAFLTARQNRLAGDAAAAVFAHLEYAARLGYPPSEVERENLLVRADQEFRKVEPQLQSLLDVNPDDRDVLLTLAIGWVRLQNLERAETLLQPLFLRDAADPAALWIQGRVRLQQHLAHEARRDLEEAIARGGDSYFANDARFLLANCLLELGKFEAALALFQECPPQAPTKPKSLFGVARCEWYLNYMEDAEAAFQELLEMQPEHLDALSQLGYIYEEHGRLSEAVQLLERAAQADPSWYDLHFRMAKLLRALGQTDRARDHEKLAAELQRRWARPRTRPAGMSNAYTGDDQGASHKSVDD
jgi:tetratricopeptide (TPR) repeat protein